MSEVDKSPLKDRDLMPFGEHKGKQMKDVPAGYLDWLDGQDWLPKRWPRVKAYIDHNRAVIDKELEDPKQYG
jgi:hypothetical protein